MMQPRAPASLGPGHRGRRASLLGDEHGAMALVAVFFVMFGVAIVYSLLGTAEAIFFRERMQDAADATAFSSAVMHARSMNFIVLVNIVMAALLAILIAIKLLEVVAIIGMAIAAALAWPTAGASLVAIPPLKLMQTELQSAYDAAKEPIDVALEVLNTTATTVQHAAPVAASAIAAVDIDAGWRPPVMAGFAAPPRADLPLADDEFPKLCEEGGAIVGDFATMPLPEVIAGPLSDAVSSMAGQFSGWFCGTGGKGASGSPPTFEREVERVYPRTQTMSDCAEASSQEAATGPCQESTDWERASAPDPHTGDCPAGGKCAFGDPYEQRLQLAREQCDPRVQSSTFYSYQTRPGHVTYEWNRETQEWVRGEPSYDPPVHYPPAHHAPPAFDMPLPFDSSVPPCGVPGAIYGPEYNKQVHPGGDVSRVVPVCSNEKPPLPLVLPPQDRNARDPEPIAQSQDFTEVLQIFGCKRTETLHLAGSDGERAQEGSGRSPKKLVDDAELGDEKFQIRSIVFGKFKNDEAARAVRLALWGRFAPEPPLAALRAFSDYSIAQAEYYFAGDVKREDLMWSMSWRARLRRFVAPDPTAQGEEGEDAQQAHRMLAVACGVAMEQQAMVDLEEGDSLDCVDALAKAAFISLGSMH